MDITTIGIDLAKNIFYVYGVNKRGKCVLSKAIKRAKLKSFISNIPPCLIEMEACGGFHYWFRELKKQDHKVRIMAAQFVRPYIKSNKTDYNDAEAICEAVQRPNISFCS